MRVKADSLRLPKKCFDILDEVARLRAAYGRETVNLTEVSRDDAETLSGFSAGETRDILGGDTPYFGSLEERLVLIGEGRYREALNAYFSTGEQRGYRPLGPATELLERNLFESHDGETGLMVAVTHDVNVACFLAGRGVVTSFTEETWPHYLDAVVIVRDRNYDYIEYGWLRHVDSEPMPALILKL